MHATYDGKTCTRTASAQDEHTALLLFPLSEAIAAHAHTLSLYLSLRLALCVLLVACRNNNGSIFTLCCALVPPSVRLKNCIQTAQTHTTNIKRREIDGVIRESQ